MIFLDASRINGGGIGRYIKELIKNCDCYDYYIGDANELNKLCDKKKIITKESFLKNINQFVKKDSIIHFPANNILDLSIPKGIPCKFILTIHDVIPLVIKEKTEKKTMQWYINLKTAINRADKIITVSNYSKRDIVKFYNIDEEKIIVIYNGVSDEFHKINKLYIPEYILREKTTQYSMLCTGSLLKHKNFWRILIAFRLSENYKNSMLFILKKNKLFRLLLVILGMRKSTKLIGGIEDKELNFYYNMIDFLIFPSLYEGFGMPPLEAMACGTPVICSKTSSLPEIIGEAAYYVDPYKIKDIVKAINYLQNNNYVCEELIKKGNRKAKNYSWIKMGEMTDKVLEELGN